MNYPLKLQMALTQMCIDINNATNVNGIDHLSELPRLFECNGYKFPEWLRVWIKLLEDDPLLNAEEHFNKPKVKIPAFNDMAPKYINKNSDEIMIVNSAINSICSVPNSAQHNALFVIASQILSDSTDNNPLSYEWHCKTDEFQYLSNRNNYAVFVKILQREMEFWQGNIKGKSNPPPKIGLKPAIQCI